MRRPLTIVTLAVTVLAGVGLLTGVGMLAGAGTALAHNVLVGSDPAEGARLDAGPRQVRLTFDQPVREGYNTINVVGPEGEYWTEGGVRVEGRSVTTPVRELGPAGNYTVGYRVLSNDGHSVTGEVTFTLTRAGNGTPAAPPEEAAGQPEEGADSGGTPVWPWIAGAVVLVALGLVLALRLGKPRER